MHSVEGFHDAVISCVPKSLELLVGPMFEDVFRGEVPLGEDQFKPTDEREGDARCISITIPRLAKKGWKATPQIAWKAVVNSWS